MTITEEEWYFLNSAKIWLRGIMHQGQRLLTNQQQTRDVMQAITLDTLMQHQNYLVLNDLRIVEEHFFVNSVSKAIDWLKEVKKFRKDLSINIDEFIHNFPEARDLRNMREHDVDYFKGDGKVQDRFVKKLSDVTVDGSASFSDNKDYLVGGRLNVQQAIDAAQKLYPKIEKASLEIHDVE